MSRVEELWNALARQHERPVFRRIDDIHPLDLYVGLDVGDDRVIMLVSDHEPTSPPEFESLEVSKTIRADGRWVLALRLKRADLAGPFSILCSDVTDSTKTIKPADGPSAVLARVYRWKKLLQLDMSGLSDSEIRGLLGELLLLHNFVIPHFGANPGVRGWTGPSDAPQDFRLPTMAIEVKTCQTGSNKISISSLDQLDAAGETLYLVVTPLSESSEADQSAVSLIALVARVKKLINEDTDALQEFELRLTQAGYSESDSGVQRYFRPERTVVLRVGEGFPRLTRTSVSNGIMDATYVLDLGLCKDFQSSFE